MKYFFVVSLHKEDNYVVSGYMKDRSLSYMRPMYKGDWREKVILGTFYSKRNQMKFTNVRVDHLIRFLKTKFEDCEVAYDGE